MKAVAYELRLNRSAPLNWGSFLIACYRKDIKTQKHLAIFARDN